MSNANGVGGFTGTSRVVQNVEQVVHRHGLVAGLDDDPRLAADDDLAGDRRRPRGRRRGVRSRRRRDEHQPDAALRRRGELLRLEVLAVDVGDGLHRLTRRELVELRAALCVGLRRSGLGADVQLDGLIRRCCWRQPPRIRRTETDPFGQIVNRPRNA